ncbi:Myb-like DNA-binding domain containing protein [Trichomonas vaginalis G3]|uniref:Myb-like DNA-binding domain containing protein n=1 Tax=Trichomonas vaginalis (strain ATCC PRA-98 / G3) TaxID=412133 RepID=A2EAL9_TRIV3|nr:RNA polymerase II transcription regulator recruiting protein [Trichomonas vaginalis G3]EAY10330.1 Myb-like DNA-binding domain containing protein [Trichomonas vaginalis G3]KAI5491046.1 RNA polymerase II transcription regulator recruiting protein [Trichomonas vaginalis G3]|eukprot:XP_001322553.1 Myb-like DNA-binding domain containing protein [Trichomonas vaginalis G3]
MSAIGKPHPKDKFTLAEDEKLRILVNALGDGNWKQISEYMITRTPRQCRDKYKNYLDPRINTGPWNKEDDEKLLNLVSAIGKKWSQIARNFIGRTDINIKSRYALLMRQEERKKHQDVEPEFYHDGKHYIIRNGNIIEDPVKNLEDELFGSFDLSDSAFEFEV